MLMQRFAVAVARRVAVAASALPRGLATTAIRGKALSDPAKPEVKVKSLSEIRTMEDLIGPGAKDGSVPTDLEQATGLERLEILGKMEGIDIFEMKPLDASRRGTLEDPILVKSAGDEQYLGCTGFPVDSHDVVWNVVSRDRPIERCEECGNVYKMEYIGPEDDHHGHDHHGYKEPKTWADFVRPEYRTR